MGSATRSALVVATSIGAIEALKDQGICRWNGVLRSVQQCAKNNIRSLSQAPNKISAAESSCSLVAMSKMRDESLRQSEDSFNKVMFLSSWGGS